MYVGRKLKVVDITRIQPLVLSRVACDEETFKRSQEHGGVSFTFTMAERPEQTQKGLPLTRVIRLGASGGGGDKNERHYKL